MNKAQTAVRLADDVNIDGPAFDSILGISRSERYRRIEDGLLPHGIPLGPQKRVWTLSEANCLRSALAAGLSPEEIRDLVVNQLAARKSGERIEFREWYAVRAGQDALELSREALL